MRQLFCRTSCAQRMSHGKLPWPVRIVHCSFIELVNRSTAHSLFTSGLPAARPDPMVRPRPQNSQDKAYRHLKERIVTLAAKQGTPLRASEIATHLKISRTPVREALSRLEQEGFVLRQDGWGYVVRSLTPRDILNLFTIRESLEVQAALEAVPQVDDALLGKLAANLKQCTLLLRLERYAAFRALGREFHLTIAGAAGNALLYRLLTTIRDSILLVGAMHQDMRPGRAQQVLAENAALYESLCLRDPQAVQAAVLHHIRSSRASIFPDAPALVAPVRAAGVPKKATSRARKGRAAAVNRRHTIS
jgi:DNA-binding GntR family transcriptional regulator